MRQPTREPSGSGREDAISTKPIGGNPAVKMTGPDLCNAHQESNSPCHFKRLPRELRDQIYDYVFDRQQVAIACSRAHDRESTLSTYLQKILCRIPKHYLALLLVSQQLFHEAAAIYYSKTTFIIDIFRGHDFLQHTSASRLTHVRKVKINMGNFGYTWVSKEYQEQQQSTFFENLSKMEGLRSIDIQNGNRAGSSLALEGMGAKELMEVMGTLNPKRPSGFDILRRA